MSFVSLNIEYFPDPTRGVPVYNGYIYIGEPNTDPEIPGNQKTVTLLKSDGTEVATTQPLRTGAGGVVLYDNSPVQVLVEGSYSLKVLDEYSSQVYYLPRATGTEAVGVSLLLNSLKSLYGMEDGAIELTSGRDAQGDQGGGRWVFSASDLSSKVATDPLSGLYAAPNDDVTGASGAWVRQTGIVRPEYFGAYPNTEGGVGLQGMINSGRVIDFQEANRFLSNIPITVTLGGKFSFDGRFSEIAFLGCDGMTVDTTGEWSQIDVRNTVFLTDSVGGYTGLTFDGNAASSGSGASNTLYGLLFMGIDDFDGVAKEQTWGVALQLDYSDNTKITNCRFSGAQADRLTVPPFISSSTIGVIVSAGTHVVFDTCSILFFDTAVRITGQSENFVFRNSNIVANNKGIHGDGLVRPSNNFYLTNSHFSCYEYNVYIEATESAHNTIMHFITGCLFFRRADQPQPGFIHVDITAGIGTQISNNYFYESGSLGIVALASTAIMLRDAHSTHITNNMCSSILTFVNVDSLCIETAIRGNLTFENVVLQAPVVIDAGRRTYMWGNSGSRAQLWGTQTATGSGSLQFLSREDTIFKMVPGDINATNWLEVINDGDGSPPFFRSAGLNDVDVDIKLVTKGAGKLQLPSPHKSTVDAPITGFIEVKDAHGEVHKLAIIA